MKNWIGYPKKRLAEEHLPFESFLRAVYPYAASRSVALWRMLFFPRQSILPAIVQPLWRCMMRTYVRVLSIALSIVMAIGLCPGLALARQGFLAVSGSTLAPQAIGVDDYPANLKAAARDSLIDPWRFYNRECTSFVAWRLNNDNGVAFNNYYRGAHWGNAGNWGVAARSLGIAVNSTAAVGSVAWWGYGASGSYGHVAWVQSVNGGSITIEEYNMNWSGNYGRRTIAASSVSGFIHIKDLNPGHDPVGFLDAASGGDGTVTISGWARDDDEPNSALEIHVYIGGSSASGEGHGGIIANVYRPDVGAHGFSTTINTDKRGAVDVYAYAINKGGGSNVLLPSPKRVTISYPPQGCLDKAEGGDGIVRVRGWALDRDIPDTQLNVHFYAGGPAGQGKYIGSAVADKPRSDVNRVIGVSGNHGFDATLKTDKRGCTDIYAYAISVEKNARNPQLSYVQSATVLEPKGSATSVSEATYAIRSKMDTSKGLDVAGCSKDNNANVWLWTWNGSKTDLHCQKFSVRSAGDGSYYIIANHSDKAVEVTNGLVTNSSNVAQFTQNKSMAQRWFFDKNADGTYTIRQRQSGLVMDAAGAKTADGTNIQQYSSHGGDNQKFYLVPTDASQWSVSIADQVRTGKALTPVPTVKAGGVAMKAGSDFTVSYKNNKAIGTASVTVKGKGAYTGSKTVAFRIGSASLSGASISGVKARTYTGAKQTQTPTVKLGKKTLKKGTDYTLSYSGNVNAGKATVKVVGMGNYVGTKSATFTIAKAGISGATVAAVKAQKYTGKAVKPSPKVTFKGKTLKKGTDYTLSYKNNVKRGKATVVVTGKGNFKGTKSLAFKIA